MPGIFKPAACELPLSIRTAVEGPYDDRASGEGRFRYAYRGTNPDHPDNVGLRELMRRRIPLIYFLGLVPGRYLVAWPLWTKRQSDSQQEDRHSPSHHLVSARTLDGGASDSQMDCRLA